jgi:hypothetical protein
MDASGPVTDLAGVESLITRDWSIVGGRSGPVEAAAEHKASAPPGALVRLSGAGRALARGYAGGSSTSSQQASS